MRFTVGTKLLRQKGSSCNTIKSQGNLEMEASPLIPVKSVLVPGTLL